MSPSRRRTIAITGDATDGALLIHAAGAADLDELRDVREIAEQPFSYKAKCMISPAMFATPSSRRLPST